MENKLEMDIENVDIERSHQTGKKSKNKSRPIVAQFSFYKDKMNILKNCKKVEKTLRETASLERQLPSARKNGKKFLPIEKKV